MGMSKKTMLGINFLKTGGKIEIEIKCFMIINKNRDIDILLMLSLKL